MRVRACMRVCVCVMHKHTYVHVTSVLCACSSLIHPSVPTGPPPPPCTIGFNQAMYTVEEDDRQVRVCVDMECPENRTGFARVEVYRDDKPVSDKRLAGKYVVVM